MGLLGFCVDAGVLSTVMWVWNLAPEVARVPAFLAAVATTWILNRHFTFQTARPPRAREFIVYLWAMSLGLAVNYTVFVVIVRSIDMMSAQPVLALAPATLAGMGFNFMTSQRILQDRDQ